MGVVFPKTSINDLVKIGLKENKMKEKEIHIEPDWELRIKKAQNGFVVETFNELSGEGDPVYRREFEVFEEKGEMSLEHIVSMLYYIINYFDTVADRAGKVLDIQVKDAE